MQFQLVLFENEVIEYTGRSSNDLTGCTTRNKLLPTEELVLLNTTAGNSCDSGAKVFGCIQNSDS